MEVLIVDADNGLTQAVKRTAEVLTGGGLVAFPTETVYGLGVRADLPAAVARLRDIKGRATEKALTVHVGDRTDAEKFVPELSGIARRLIRRGWPGPLTLVLSADEPSKAAILKGLNGSATSAMYYDGTVGIRCPDDPVASRLLRAVAAPIVATSANRGGQQPAVTAEEVRHSLNGHIDLLIDAGRTKYSKPSTVVRVKATSFEVLREGVLDARMIGQMATLRLLFVCTGNTCRSPMAAGLAKGMIAQRLGCAVQDLQRRGILVESAGTAGGYGRAADQAIAVLADRGLDLTDHVSTALRAESVQQADHVFVMTRSHLDAVLEIVPSAAARARTLLDQEDVTDPIGGSKEEYESCAARITAGLEVRLREIDL